MRVQLRSVEAAMSQKQCNVFDAHAVLQQVGGDGVAKYVQRQAFCLYCPVIADALQVLQPSVQRGFCAYKQAVVV